MANGSKLRNTKAGSLKGKRFPRVRSIVTNTEIRMKLHAEMRSHAIQTTECFMPITCIIWKKKCSYVRYIPLRLIATVVFEYMVLSASLKCNAETSQSDSFGGKCMGVLLQARMQFST